MTLPLIVDDGSVEVLGVSVFGPKPITRAHLRFDDELIALYGKNGVGKTRALRAISDLLAGVTRADQRGLVHFKITQPDKPDPGRWLGEVLALAVKSLREGLELKPEPAWQGSYALHSIESELAQFSVDSSRAAPEIGLTTVMYRAVSLAAEQQHCQDVDELVANEIADGGYITAVATGSERSPAWTLFASVAPNMPSFRRFVSDDYHQANLEISRRRSSLVQSFLPRLKDGEDPTSLVEDLTEIGSPVEPDGFILWELANFSLYSRAAEADLDTVWGSDWAPVPLASLGVVHWLPVEERPLGVDESHLSSRTIDFIFSDGPRTRVGLTADRGEVVESDEFRDRADALAREATKIFTEIMYGQPVPPAHDSLQFEIGHLDEWLRGRPPRWVSSQGGDGGDVKVPLVDLSKAQRRWAVHAINQSLLRTGIGTVSLIDEPEDGLHRSVESRLPAALRKIAGAAGSWTICATHSPNMLVNSSLYHLARTGSRTLVTQNALNLAGNGRYLEGIIDELGVQPADFLQMVKCFILVEGQHDVIVLESMLGAELQAAGARVVPMRGALNAGNAVGADLLVTYTAADIVLVTDNIDADAIKAIWRDVQSYVDKNERKQAEQRLAQLGQLPGREAEWMREALHIAIENRIVGRIKPVSLRQPDVICYLPVEKFVPGATWVEIVSEWKRAYPRGARDRGYKNLKDWMKSRFGISINRKLIEQAADGAPIHEDIRRISEAAGASVVVPADLRDIDI